MKKSYKLIGVFWDGKPLPSKVPSVDYEENIEGSDSALRLSKILSLKDSEIETFNTKKYNSIFIDMLPAYSSIVLKFYLKRLLQITEYFKLPLKCNNPNDIQLINKSFVSAT